jgi:acyl-CoA dehydrogenase
MSDLETFRAETRAWLEAHCPESQRQPILKREQIWGGRNRVFPSADAQAWFEAMADRGWTAPSWPKEYGGGGLSIEEAKVLQQEMARLKCRPPLYEIGIWMFGPALLAYGNEAQKQEHIPKIVKGEIRWAQGYSEPGAGSDLASLKTKAEDMGDHFLVNGTKIWTTNAHKADWIFCLVRTDPSAPKQQGISFLLIDMASEGVSVSPIELISGESEFCQTFFDNVKVPKENLVGELNKGWDVAKELLKHERTLMSSMESMSEKEDFSLLELAQQYLSLNSEGAIEDGEIRSRIAQLLMEMEAFEQLNERMFYQYKAKQVDQRLGMLLKHIGTKQLQRKDELILEVLGNKALSWTAPTANQQEHIVTRNWAFNKTHTIAGGTSEIQLNIIAKRALGMAS